MKKLFILLLTLFAVKAVDAHYGMHHMHESAEDCAYAINALQKESIIEPAGLAKEWIALKAESEAVSP